jgi:Tol biopolymer transport system component
VTDRLNLGELCRRKVLLFTREAAAIVHEVATRLSESTEEGTTVVAPTVDQLWVTANGELIVEVPASTTHERQETMAILASLIEALLPPTLRNQPDYAVPGSFRILAPRARGWPPGLPPLKTPGDLAAAVSRYRSGDTTAVLQHLYARAARALEPVAPVEPSPEPAQVKTAQVLSAPVAATVTAATVTAAAATMAVSADSPRAVEDNDFDLPLRTSAVWVPPFASEARRRPSRVWLLLASTFALALSLAVGYGVTRLAIPRSETSALASEEAATRDERDASQPSYEVSAPNAAPDTIPVLPPRSRAGADANSLDASSPRTAAASSNPVVVPPVTTPAPLDISVEGPVFSPSFTASGSSVMFHAGRDPAARLLSADLSGNSAPLEVVTVVDGTARNWHPRVSPDGRFLAFDSDRDGERGIYVANRDGSDVHRVSGPGFAAVPSWSPDMRALAFVRAEPDNPRVWNLWQLDRGSGAQTRLTSHRYGQTWGASWLPDSRRLCYSHEDRLVVLDTQSGNTRTYASPLSGRLVRTPAVSPDGRLVAFQVMRSGVWLLDLESGAMRRLIDDPAAEEFAWSPDGGRLAYHSRRDGEWRIWIAAPPRQLPESP